MAAASLALRYGLAESFNRPAVTFDFKCLQGFSSVIIVYSIQAFDIILLARLIHIRVPAVIIHTTSINTIGIRESVIFLS